MIKYIVIFYILIFIVLSFPKKDEKKVLIIKKGDKIYCNDGKALLEANKNIFKYDIVKASSFVQLRKYRQWILKSGAIANPKGCEMWKTIGNRFIAYRSKDGFIFFNKIKK